MTKRIQVRCSTVPLVKVGDNGNVYTSQWVQRTEWNRIETEILPHPPYLRQWVNGAKVRITRREPKARRRALIAMSRKVDA